ncbi:MAG: DNA polymerase III subunit alpha [Patescibacteria group bacterium]|nr:DNA polymerase III subunit alpha [Patescibacteria group bacterium]
MFVHLHNHTHYSLLDGLTKIDEMVKYAKEQGSPAIAITDHGTMYGVIEFYERCKKEGIKPIIGVETYLAPRGRTLKETVEDRANHHLLLLAKNNAGYKNLIKLVSAAHLEGFYYKPRIDWELLEKYHDGLIACTACLGGEIPHLIEAGQIDKARKRILEYNELFGQGNFFLEIQDHPNLEGQAECNAQMVKFSRELGISLVATNDIHYFRKDDAEAQDILLCLQNKKKVEDEDRMNMMGTDFSMRSNEEMLAAFKDIPEATANTLKIAEMCNVEIPLGQIQLPYFPVPAGFDEIGYLENWAHEGCKKRYGKTYAEMDKARKDRIDYEISVIKKMGWPSYFLIVADFINWAKDSGIIVGPGRGSAAGSLVCYLIGITNLDPLDYDLLFERFLNPERISMPDIDTDFADTGRDAVIRYVEGKYGKDHVSQIITFGTIAARASMRDVGRVLDMPYDYCDKLAKMIPLMMDLSETLETVQEFKDIYNKEADARKIIDYALRLEGVARHASTHACGVLITKEPLTEYVPIQYASTSDLTVVSQYSLHPIEDLGLLKMDFLGLKNLTIIEAALKIIKRTRGVELKMDEFPLDDKTAYKLFQNGETTGVFQFESSGMKRYLKELKPTVFEDIIAMVALYRPGPMEWIPDYISGKHGRKRVQYLHPVLKPILDKTYGVAIYQEQVMQIARDLAGFTMGEADVLRKAVGKKIAKLLAEQKEKFVEGCMKKGVPKELGEQVFSFIEPFAGYGFNRSHAACYAMIGYQTAYLKAHYPAEFMAALLTSDQQDIDRIAIEIEECRNMGIKVLSPDINESFASFTVVKDEKTGEEFIRFGLNAVKNVGEHIVEVVIEERKTNGRYKDIFDLLERIVDRDMNKKSLESLAKCGALDQFNDRGLLLANMEALLEFNKEVSRNKDSKQVSLFGNPSGTAPGRIKLDKSATVTQQEKLSWEKELLGLYVSAHPFNDFKKHLDNFIVPIAGLSSHLNEDAVRTAGVITVVKKIITRSNKPMLFVKIEDAAASTELLVFPNLYETTAELWQPGKVILAQGKISDKDQEVKLLVDKAAVLTLDNLAANIDSFKKIEVNNRKQFNGNGNNYFRRPESSFVPPSGTAGDKPPFATASGDKPPFATASGDKPAPIIQTGPPPLKLFFKKDLSAEQSALLKQILAQASGSSRVLIKIIRNGAPVIIEGGFRVNNNLNLVNQIKKEFSGSIEVVDAK